MLRLQLGDRVEATIWRHEVTAKQVPVEKLLESAGPTLIAQGYWCCEAVSRQHNGYIAQARGEHADNKGGTPELVDMQMRWARLVYPLHQRLQAALRIVPVRRFSVCPLGANL